MSTAKPHPSRQPEQAWTLLLCSRKAGPKGRHVGQLNSTHVAPYYLLLLLQWLRGVCDRELRQHSPHPSQTHLPSYPNKEPQSHQPPSCGATAVLSLQLSHSSQKPMAGDQSTALRTAALQREKTPEHRKGLRGSTLHLCATVTAAKWYLGMNFPVTEV